MDPSKGKQIQNESDDELSDNEEENQVIHILRVLWQATFELWLL